MNVFGRCALSTPRLVVGLLVFGAACHRQAPASAPAAPGTAISSGASLIRAMHDRYAPGWFSDITFVQKTTVSLTSGSQVVQTWYGAGRLPGHWRTDTDLASKGGLLHVGDSTYQFSNGKLVKADTGTNEILLLNFDLDAQSQAGAEALLRRLGLDLTRFHEGVWRGVPVYVLGAVRGDTMSKQLWIDREHLLPIRFLENTRQGHADVRFNKHVQVGGGWIATEIEQYVNGKRRLLEQYSQIRTNVPLSDALFDPHRWATAPHWTP
jgi:hypothetical protein